MNSDEYEYFYSNSSLRDWDITYVNTDDRFMHISDDSSFYNSQPITITIRQFNTPNEYRAFCTAMIYDY